ncbi:aldo/keto reductase [Latilactobacillus sakei]|jgi:L-glyceraldehyde 3-phosphate reductase|uniref:L-glyceraldehyde 3-phosphate reductase n=2 Tax=Latilactobacillus TaxID=2767885 RepID=A0A9N7J005_LATSK|nr:aldo/keto reductase [Latilactobacillus sakei]AST84660.1 L-glyceraldehyde 3-phosphate reductase [Latilactobacillus sakei]AWZ42611.1 L-glyceraldehyde 3-phosphate reductase [Latilactobacillus sakei]AWZ46213.1 L-glyceraldehyde 3-phosphate reductase [Latilactobacillus sakei]AYG15992.1 L-glyceraldehyde 3-phosphate reductase [Latilactobacillus sakei]AYG24714.1 L-glyceraldehyde 3-phosphate reductase [Latilactobacillus sakei]
MYNAKATRYDDMIYRRVGHSGLKLPAISLGLWHNFGETDKVATQKEIIFGAFDMGITHFDLANNYGPPAGSAEENFGRILHSDLKQYRDEMIISSKAGYYMWPGPYGEWGSKKNLIASCDQSLQRMQLDYVDIFYSHRPDPETPIEETARALDLLVHQGKALYIGISNYSAEQTKAITKIFRELGTPFIIHQPRYNMLDRWIEDGLTDVLAEEGLGAITFSPLAQGMLTNRYLNGIPADSRAARPDSPFLSPEKVDQTISTVQELNKIAQQRGQSLAEMALAWNLQQPTVASVLVGASRLSQLQDSVHALDNLTFAPEELAAIQKVLK